MSKEAVIAEKRFLGIVVSTKPTDSNVNCTFVEKMPTLVTNMGTELADRVKITLSNFTENSMAITAKCIGTVDKCLGGVLTEEESTEQVTIKSKEEINGAYANSRIPGLKTTFRYEADYKSKPNVLLRANDKVADKMISGIDSISTLADKASKWPMEMDIRFLGRHLWNAPIEPGTVCIFEGNIPVREWSLVGKQLEVELTYDGMSSRTAKTLLYRAGLDGAGFSSRIPGITKTLKFDPAKAPNAPVK